MSLKQIAAFYNSIQTQIVPSQMSMLLEPAKAFERAVLNPFADTTPGPLAVIDQRSSYISFPWCAKLRCMPASARPLFPPCVPLLLLLSSQ